MPVLLNDALTHRLQTEDVIWLTTVRPDGSPVPTPVWFFWNGESFRMWFNFFACGDSCRTRAEVQGWLRFQEACPTPHPCAELHPN